MGGQCSAPQTAHALAKYVESSALAGLLLPREEAQKPRGGARARLPIRCERRATEARSLLKEGLDEAVSLKSGVSQRALKLELLACLYHQGRSLGSVYEYTSDPPTVVGSGFSGEVVLCRRREKTAVRQNTETAVRCVKKFELESMGPDQLAKLKNEATIYLSLEHPSIARLFDVFEDQSEVSLVMQYCSGGTLEHALKRMGAFPEDLFKQHAVPMLSAVNYIHRAGIVHRDIKPRNWVYEADRLTVKLIDFGFSVKQFLGAESGDSLQGCLGTLGYLAPEVVRAGLAAGAAYGAGCDIWSLGAVFLELLAGEPAFHRDRGFCDGYTEEVVLREIQDVSCEVVEARLAGAPDASRPFLRQLLQPDADRRPAAAQALQDPYLASAVEKLLRPARALPVHVVLDRFRAHGRASKPSRAWLQAVARSPTHLPWNEFCMLRNTFKMFDASGGFRGTVDLAAFCATVLASISGGSGTEAGGFGGLKASRASIAEAEEDEAYWDSYAQVKGAVCTDAPESGRSQAAAWSLSPADPEAILSPTEVAGVWRSVCGEQESLSYCEFLAVLLPPIEDVFEDETPRGTAYSSSAGERPPSRAGAQAEWRPEEPISGFLSLLQMAAPGKVPVFRGGERVQDVVKAMSGDHRRWSVIQFGDGRRSFFDYMDVNHELLKQLACHKQDRASASEALARLSAMPAGDMANCSGFSAFVPCDGTTPLKDVLALLSRSLAWRVSGRGRGVVRRVPIVDRAGDVAHVFSCTDFLELAMRFQVPGAALRRHSAAKFDRRDAILDLSVHHDDRLVDALRIMDEHATPACAVTSRGLSGDMGGVVASSVVSVADLKWVISSGEFHVLDGTVGDLISWRSEVVNRHLGEVMRQQRLSRFNVVSVQVCDSLYHLAQRLLASKLQRIFLSSDDIARIVGIVGSRDILIEVIEELI